MTLSHRLAGLLVLAATVGLALPVPAIALDADAQEVSRYVLSEAGLAKFTQATQALSAVPGACARADEDDDDSNTESLDQLVAKLNAVPGAQAAIQSAGMTTREYIVFMFSMMQSGMSAWALKQPGGKLPPGVSQANVDFYNKHEGAMAALGKDDPCDQDTDDEGDE